MTETRCLIKLKIFTFYSFLGKVCQSLLQLILSIQEGF